LLLRFVLVVIACAVVAALLVITPGQERSSVAAACSPARTHAAGTSVEQVTTADGPRSYRLHVPPSYSGSSSVPLVLSLHGYAMNAAQQESSTGFSAAADGSGFVVAYPEGLTNSVGLRHWNHMLEPAPAPDDVGFIDELLDTLENELCIDINRVYAAGMSMGAMMTVRLACSLSPRIAAVAAVAGAYYPPLLTQATPTDVCPGARPVPLLVVHGTGDMAVPFTGGPGAIGYDFRLPIDNSGPEHDVMQGWAAHNDCTGARQEWNVGVNVRLVSYGACAEGADVQLYAIDGGVHTWPVAGTDPMDATSVAWSFLSAHPMPVYPDWDGDGSPDYVDDDDDNDLCSDVRELGTNERAGGRRDPKNPNDYFNPTRDGRIRTDDLVAVLYQYFEDMYLFSLPGQPPVPNPDYQPATDRTLVGPDPWDLGPGDGQQRLNDLQYVLYQYAHDCV
jgi:polyhydroxybutyrate depolymerase